MEPEKKEASNDAKNVEEQLQRRTAQEEEHLEQLKREPLSIEERFAKEKAEEEAKSKAFLDKCQEEVDACDAQRLR